MAMELLCCGHDVLYELKRSKINCKQLANEWDESKRLVEKNIECSYQHILRYILGDIEMREHHKRKRENVIYIDDDDDCNGEGDPQYGLFLSRLKEHEKSYVVESEKSGLPGPIIYEIESGSEDESEEESQRKMMSCAEQMVGLSNQKHDILNNRALLVLHPSDMQAQSGNSSSTECARLLMNLVKRDNVMSRESELLSQNSHTRINWLTGNECDHNDQARTVKKEKLQITSGKVVKGDCGADLGAHIQIGKGHLYQRHGSKDNWVTKSLIEHVDPAQPVEKKKVQNQRKSKKLVQIDNKHSHRHSHSVLGPGNDRLVKNQSEHARQAQTAFDNNVQDLKKKVEVVKGTNLVKEENESCRTDAIQIDNAQWYQKPSWKNWVKENPYEHVGRAQPGKKDKVHNRVYMQQLDKGKNVVGEDGRANRKGKNVVGEDGRANWRAVVQIDHEHLPQHPGQMNNWWTKYQNEHIDQAHPVMKYKEQMDRKLKGKSIVKGDHEANQKTMIQIDTENFYQVPGPRTDWVNRNFCECVDRVQIGKSNAIHDHKESTRVVQCEHGLSTLLGGEGIHNKISTVKATKCLVVYKNSDGDNLEKEGNDETIPDVEILDSAACIKQGILGPFVPSKRFHNSMVDDGFQDLGRPSVSDEFRREVLKVIRKPFDKEEYNRHRQAIKIGSFLDHYPDLGKRLKKHRYRRGKCLAILRGFFFWLQNLTREGAFQPWNDRRCLAVEPSSP